MAKSKGKKPVAKNNSWSKDLALIIIATELIYIVYKNIFAVSVVIILLAIILMIGLYFILPVVGIEGIAGIALRNRKR